MNDGTERRTGADWQDCIVIYLDLPGLKRLAEKRSSDASTRMREFHDVVRRVASTDLQSLDHTYVWNDSALLLGLVEGASAQVRMCLRAAEQLKRAVDEWMSGWSDKRSYAIAVKGQTFPSDGGTVSHDARRVTVLRTSSFAMGNCFLIEEAARTKKMKHLWYLDNRLVKHIPGLRPSEFLPVQLMRRRGRSRVHCFDGYLWKEE